MSTCTASFEIASITAGGGNPSCRQRHPHSGASSPPFPKSVPKRKRGVQEAVYDPPVPVGIGAHTSGRFLASRIRSQNPPPKGGAHEGYDPTPDLSASAPTIVGASLASKIRFQSPFPIEAWSASSRIYQPPEAAIVKVYSKVLY